MTVPTETSEATYTGNGATTAFSTGFLYLNNDEVVVTLALSGAAATIQVEGVHYDLPEVDAVPGTVTFDTAPPSGSTVHIYREVPFTQETAFRSQGTFSPAVHENTVDEVVYQTQQLDRRLRAIEGGSSAETVLAGSGLLYGGDGVTLHVGAGSGVQVNADDVEVLYGAAGAIANVTKAAAAAGVANTAARADHKHDITTAAATDLYASLTNAEGSAATLARSDHKHGIPVAAPVELSDSANSAGGAVYTFNCSDHVHAHGNRGGGSLHAVVSGAANGFMIAADKTRLDTMTAGGTPADVTKAAAAAGVAASYARSDHKHDITTAAAATLTDSTNAEGSATTLARSDHTHSHGTRGGGTLHADATNAAAGFHSMWDKNRGDLVAVGARQTPNATPLEINFNEERAGTYGILSGGVWITRTNEDVAVTFEVVVTAKDTASAESASWGMVALVTRTSGAGPTLVSSATLWHFNTAGAAAWAVALNASVISATVDTFGVDVTGAAATTIQWTAVVRQLPSRSASTAYYP